jgi:hypothetical protein
MEGWGEESVPKTEAVKHEGEAGTPGSKACWERIFQAADSAKCGATRGTGGLWALEEQTGHCDQAPRGDRKG